MSQHKVAWLVVIAVGSIAALVSGASFLESSILGLPIGNALVVIALCALACAAIALSRPGTAPRYVAFASLIAGFAWLPLSIGLAGNLALNFDGQRGQIWIWLSLATMVLVLVALVWATIDHLIRRHSSGGSANAGA